MCWRGGPLLHKIIQAPKPCQPTSVVIFQGLRVIYQISSIEPVRKEKEGGESHIVFFRVEALEVTCIISTTFHSLNCRGH